MFANIEYIFTVRLKSERLSHGTLMFVQGVDSLLSGVAPRR